MTRWLSLFYILLLICCCNAATAQKENSIWCFGQGVGLNFNTQPPSFFTHNMDAFEGCVTVSSATGNLLFYSLGSRIWDRNGNVMPNSIGLLGNGPVIGGIPKGSSEGGTLALRSVTDTNIYYSFCIGAYEDGQPKLWYSVIDMRLNGGMGDVVPTQKNIFLVDSLSESLTFTFGSDCNSYWVVVKKDWMPATRYLAFRVDAFGVHTTPVVSTAPQVVAAPPVFSNDGKRMYAANGRLYIYDFNRATGMFSAPVTATPADLSFTWPMAVSPDDTKLYFCTLGPTGQVTQCNISLLPDTNAVKSSKVAIATGLYVDIQPATDGKLYLATLSPSTPQAALAAIEAPNNAGAACLFNPLILQLPPSMPFPTYDFYRFSKPFHLPEAGDTIIHAVKDTTFCFSSQGQLTLPPSNVYLWSTGEQTQSITISQEGRYWAWSRGSCSNYIDSFNVRFIDFDVAMGADTQICPGDTFLIQPTMPDDAHYRWQDGSTAPSYAATAAGRYTIAVSKGGCTLSDTLSVGLIDPYVRILQRDTSFCSDVPFRLDATVNPPGDLRWNTGATAQAIDIDQAGWYSVTADNVCGRFTDSVYIDIKGCQCRSYIPNAFSPNGDGINDVFQVTFNCPDVSSYVLSVYDRWGKRVFLSKVPGEGWDGSHKGGMADAGTYFYYLRYKHSLLGEVTKKGDVVLIR